MYHTAQRIHIPLVWSIAIMAVAGLATWLLVAVYSSRVSEEADRPFAVIENSRGGERALSTSVIGTLVSVSRTELTLVATPANNPGFARDTMVTALLTPTTAYSRSSVPLAVPDGAASDLASLYRFSPASLGDLKVGMDMRVNIRTGQAVKGKTEVTAESIEILAIR